MYGKERNEKGQPRLLRIAAGILCLLATIALQIAARRIGGFAGWYADTIYPLWLNSAGRFFSLFRFSFFEWLILGAAVCIVLSAVGFLKRLSGRKAGKYGSRLWQAASFLLLLFTLNAGINYSRDAFSEYSGIEVKESSVQELILLCTWLTQEANDWSERVERDSRGLCSVDGSAAGDAVAAMQKTGEEYDVLSGYYPKPKALFFSWVLSYQHISGIFSPFTIEANYNGDMPDFNIPFAMCHELSHAKGFMREDEANFIAYLACSFSDESEFQYSGALTAWSYCMNRLAKEDAAAYEEIYGMLNESVRTDLEEDRRFWRKYEGTASDISQELNSRYLKANSQEDGIKSYGRMTDLLLAYFFQSAESKRFQY